MNRKTAGRIVLAFLLPLPALAFAHFIVFPQETRCILICLSDFKRHGNLYFKNNADPNKLARLLKAKAFVEKKDRVFWQGNIKMNYKLIYCSTEQDFARYGPSGAPAATYMKLGASVVIKDESIDQNIISHELSHAILYKNIGWYKRTFIIPTWFDEGLAMQVDDRTYYSVDTLLVKRPAQKLQDITIFKKASDFFSGDNETIILHYATAKYVVHEWLKTHYLKNFIDAIRRGENFNKAYNTR